MSKPLSEMTLEELWQLFPIFLTEHKDIWEEWYTEEANRIKSFLPVPDIKINHIGSTAIKNIWAKPIIDILVEIPDSFSMEEIKNTIVSGGYICMSEEQNRKSFNRGYTENGFAEKVFHLHLRYYGDNDELYFRDYMNDDPLIAKQYEELKLSLWKKYEHDRDGYTAAKSNFVTVQTNNAKKKYGSKDSVL